jgi:hypothetical protein
MARCLHVFRGTRNLVTAFIDDISQKLIHWQVLPDKKPSTTAATFFAALDQAPHVWGIWTDAGGELMKAFATVVKEGEIRQTQPRNPDQNGKIKCWWHLPDEHDIAPPVRRCNASPHTCLPRRQTARGIAPMTRDMGYDVPLRSDTSLPVTWTVGGESRALPVSD